MTKRSTAQSDNPNIPPDHLGIFSPEARAQLYGDATARDAARRPKKDATCAIAARAPVRMRDELERALDAVFDAGVRPTALSRRSVRAGYTMSDVVIAAIKQTYGVGEPNMELIVAMREALKT